MNMKINLETSIDNLLYLDYMEKQQRKHDTEPNENQNNSCCTQVLPQDKKEN